MLKTIEEAKVVLLETLPKGSTIEGETEYDGKYLFIAHRPDPLEGRLMPFFSVDKATKEVMDFSPQDYPNPLEIIKKLST